MSVWSAPDQWMRGWCDQIYDSSSSSREETQREETNQDKTLIWARDSSSSSSSSCQWLDPDTHWSDQGIDPSRVFYFFIFFKCNVSRFGSNTLHHNTAGHVLIMCLPLRLWTQRGPLRSKPGGETHYENSSLVWDVTAGHEFHVLTWSGANL